MMNFIRSVYLYSVTLLIVNVLAVPTEMRWVW